MKTFRTYLSEQKPRYDDEPSIEKRKMITVTDKGGKTEVNVEAVKWILKNPKEVFKNVKRKSQFTAVFDGYRIPEEGEPIKVRSRATLPIYIEPDFRFPALAKDDFEGLKLSIDDFKLFIDGEFNEDNIWGFTIGGLEEFLEDDKESLAEKYDTGYGKKLISIKGTFTLTDAVKSTESESIITELSKYARWNKVQEDKVGKKDENTPDPTEEEKGAEPEEVTAEEETPPKEGEQ